MDPHETEDPPEEIDAGLAFAYGEEDVPGPFESVVERVAERTGAPARVTLRDAEASGATPMLRPLGPGEPQRIGKYAVHGELGRGGLGTVHRGHDRELGRDVALKFLQSRYRDEREVLQRFVEEAQIGGQLQHPGIVPVYDLGMANGRPFFAMKLVKGETLARKLSRRGSPAADRRSFLAIFEDVCQTMAYAHARGVVHRDLKPANVMIGSFGEVQVVDWGMGKVLSQGGVADERPPGGRLAPASRVETVRTRDHGSRSVVGSVMGTPAYMPPEQARGDVEAMDERSDVFALGAILCEILTGQPPYVGRSDEQVQRAAAADLDDARGRLSECGAEPEVVELALRCLAPDQAARPRDAGLVAQAVHDHLAAFEARLHDARVEAAEARVRAAALKRTQTLGLGLTAAIAAGLLASLWLWRRADAAARSEQEAHGAALASADEARRSEARAERELERALEIKRLVTDMLRGVTPEEAQLADTALLKGILDRTADRLARGAVEDELVAAEVHHVVGDTYRTLAVYDEAERHLPRALEIRARLLGARHDDTLSSRTARAHLLYALGRYAEAEAELRAILDLHGCAAGGACAVGRAAQRLLASTVQNFARFDEAERLYLELLEIQRDVLGEEGLETQESVLGLAMLYFEAGRLDEAELVLREALEVAERVLGAAHPHSVRTRRSLASLRVHQGRYEEALRLYEECVRVAERLWGAEHAETLLLRQELAIVHMKRGDQGAAESRLRETLASQERVLGKEHPATLALAANLAALYLETGRFDEAEPRFLELLEIQRRVSGAESTDTLSTRTNLATIHLQRGRFPEAERMCREVLATQERILGSEHPDTLHTKWLAASALTAQGRYQEAERLLLEVVEIGRRAPGGELPETLVALETLASDYVHVGRLDDAEELFVEAIEGWTRLVGEDQPQTWFVRVNLGLLHMSQGRDDGAEEDVRRALEGMKWTLGADHPHTLIAIGNFGSTCSMRGNHQEAIATLAPHLATMRRVFGDGDARVNRAVEALAGSFVALGRREEALPLLGGLLDQRVAAAWSTQDASVLNDVAWDLVDHPLEELHDPERALGLAERACELEEQNAGGTSLWIYLDTLALAQHRTGGTRTAAETQRRALSLLPQGVDEGIVHEMTERRERYETVLE